MNKRKFREERLKQDREFLQVRKSELYIQMKRLEGGISNLSKNILKDLMKELLKEITEETEKS